MAINFNTKFSLLLLLLSFSLFLLPSLCQQGEESAAAELFECFLKCGRGSGNQHELSDCEQKCVDRFRERERQEREEGGGPSRENHHQPQPELQYKQCRSKCGRKEAAQAKKCEQECQTQYEKQKREHGEANRARKESEQESPNPYFFKSQMFDSKYRTEEGHIKVLQRFSKKSELLEGIDNYRLAVLEANPNTFVLPHHCDAESVFVVVGGRGTISYVVKNQRQSHNMKLGDVIRVPAGSIVYLINRDDRERLYVVKLLQPVNTPGRFKEYFGVGGENPESFYGAFSNEILEAAFKTPRQTLEKLFGQQKKGVIIRASKEQIRALSQESEIQTTGRRGESSGPFNLLNERPLFASQYGQFFEASPNDHQQLRDLDVAVGFMNIKKGGMVAPYYNSRSTRLAFVVGGSGYFEMACPHLAHQNKHGSQGRTERQGETRSTDVHYEKISARLSIGDAFIVPAGHPVTMVASQDSDLQLVSFGIRGSHNQKYFLAGQENIWNEVQAEAKELSFKAPASEVEEIFKKQDQSYFLPGPGKREERERHGVASILDFVGF